MKFGTWSTLVLTVLLLVNVGCGPEKRSADQIDPWKKAKEIVRQIHTPTIPDRSFLFSEYGGVGDGTSDNKKAFERIIDAIAEQGGGRILVEAGTYLVNGPIHLESNINLHLEEGARIVFGTNPEFYLPVVLTSWEGTRAFNYSPFIYARGAANLAITGKGEIDGNASETWNNWKNLQDPDKMMIRAMNNNNVPLEERIFGKGHYLRPHLIQFYECSNILVEDVLISDSPFWCLHFVFSNDITVRGVRYEAFNFNNDGIDPESSENVLIEKVVFNNRDDNIAIKAGRDLEARTLNRPSRNIVVRNCLFSGHNAIAVGSEMSGGVYDVFVEECSYAGRVIYGFYLKGNRDRGGMVHDIYARNLEFDTTRSTLIIDSNYKNQGSCCPPVFKNVVIDGVTANHAEDHGIYLKGSPQVHLDSIFIRNVHIKSASQAVEGAYVDHLVMEDVEINGNLYEVAGGWPQWIQSTSPETGREVWQITSDTAPSVACYFERQAFTSDEKYVVYASRQSGYWRLYRTNLETGEVLEVHRQREGKISHPLINPEDPEVITYVPGPDTQDDMTLPMEQRARSWKVDLTAGTDQQFLTMPYGFRATHESWAHDGERFFFFRKTRPGWSPAAICSQDKQGGDFRVHYESEHIKLGHGTASPNGEWFVADSQEPGTNELVLLNIDSGEAQVLCWPNSSVDGGHSQRAHVHPSFSPGGKYICFTSDRTGVSQVYVVPVWDLTQSLQP